MFDRFETFATTIATINRYVQKIKSMEMKTLGLKGTHVMCLYSLGKHPEGLTATQLCRFCGEDKAAISRTITELTEKDFVHSEASREKRAYRSRISLTEKGKYSMTYINDRVNHALDVVGNGLSDDQRKTFYYALDLISNNLKIYIETEGKDK